MDPEQALKTAEETAKAVSKLSTITEKIFGPRNTKRQADADEYSANKKIQIIRNNPDMDIRFQNGEISIERKKVEELLNNATRREIVAAVKQEQNIENIIDLAMEEAKYVDDVADEQVDEDWIIRFFNIAKDISTEEMQHIWAKILTGEITRPSSYSLRTLDILRNMSKSEAEVFQKAIPLICSDYSKSFIYANTKALEIGGITYSDILTLEECGLLISSQAISFTKEVKPKGGTSIVSNGYAIGLIKNTQSIGTTNVNIGVFMLTEAGKELSKIIEKKVNLEYLNFFAKEIYIKYSSEIISLIFKIDSIEDGRTIGKDDDIIYKYPPNAILFKG